MKAKFTVCLQEIETNKLLGKAEVSKMNKLMAAI